MGRIRLLLLLALTCGMARAEGRAGTVEWSDGHKQTGAISLTPGKDLRVLANDQQVALSLDEVKEIRFKPEKEEMREGFYFPTPGQATQAKTGEIYPVRYLQTEITLANGKVVAGHLVTTTVYVETDDATEKVVLMAKQTGTNGQKLAELTYPTLIRFDAGAASAGFSQIDLTQAGLVNSHPPVIVARPDLTSPPVMQTTGKQVWTVPVANPGQLLFAVEATGGIHVAWPETEADSATQHGVEAALADMRDFFDTRTLLGCFADTDAGDVYSLVMLKRLGKSVDPNGNAIGADKVPWNLVIFRWKYDPDQKKFTLLNRALLAVGGLENNTSSPVVLKEPGLLKAISKGE